MNLEEAARAVREAQAEVDRLTWRRKPLEEKLEEVRRLHIEAQAKLADAKIRLLEIAEQNT